MPRCDSAVGWAWLPRKSDDQRTAASSWTEARCSSGKAIACCWLILATASSGFCLLPPDFALLTWAAYEMEDGRVLLMGYSLEQGDVVQPSPVWIPRAR